MTALNDIAALDRAVQGIDAIIAAMHYSPESVLDGQLLLLRAAERAGVKLSLGDAEPYDPYIAFYHHARLNSTIKPLYAVTGGLLEHAFYHSPYGSPINKKDQTLPCFGDGSERTSWSSREDVAAYTIQAIPEPDAADGGSYRVESFKCSWQEFVQVYNMLLGAQLEIKSLGTLEDVQRMLEAARITTPVNQFGKYVGSSMLS
ncbi:hypothetical protein NW757_013855 [Fusarium falciforme]|nr:hypothetical protein NW757_013855 [Fusarium falciforme]